MINQLSIFRIPQNLEKKKKERAAVALSENKLTRHRVDRMMLDSGTT